MSNSRRQEEQRGAQSSQIGRFTSGRGTGVPPVGSEGLTWVMAGTATPRWKICGSFGEEKIARPWRRPSDGNRRYVRKFGEDSVVASASGGGPRVRLLRSDRPVRICL